MFLIFPCAFIFFLVILTTYLTVSSSWIIVNFTRYKFSNLSCFRRWIRSTGTRSSRRGNTVMPATLSRSSGSRSTMIQTAQEIYSSSIFYPIRIQVGFDFRKRSGLFSSRLTSVADPGLCFHFDADSVPDPIFTLWCGSGSDFSLWCGSG
jgi:hypothetical protein